MSEDTQEIEKNPIEDLVQSALDQDFNAAGKIFGEIMSVKMQDVIDQEEIKVAGQMFNGDEPDDETDLEDYEDNLDDDEAEVDEIPAEDDTEEVEEDPQEEEESTEDEE